MTFLPIVERELRVASRRGLTYWRRCFTVLAALVCTVYISIMMVRMVPQEAGLPLFIMLTVLINFYAMISGCFATADCLSEEKRDGTLGLLFLTDLRGYDVVLGKLAATSLNWLYAMVAVFPIMGITLMMGGVTFNEFLRVCLISNVNLLFSLAAGMFCSSLCRSERYASGNTVLVIMVLYCLPLIIWGIQASLGIDHLLDDLLPASPSYGCWLAFDIAWKSGHKHEFWLSVSIVFFLSMSLLFFASIITPRSWQDKARSTTGQKWSDLLRQWRYGTAQLQRVRRIQLLDVNPILWLNGRTRFAHLGMIIGFIFVAAVWLWGLWLAEHHTRDYIIGSSIPLAIACHAILKFGIASDSVRRFCEDRQSGALELVLSTPLTINEILIGHRYFLFKKYIIPTIAIVLMDLFLMLFALSTTDMHNESIAWVMVWLAGITILVWDLHALSWVGPWVGLNSAKVNRASSLAMTRICFLPWFVWITIWIAFALLTFLSRFNGSGEAIVYTMIISWFLISAANNILFTLYARDRLLNQFRNVATSRFEQLTLLGQLGRNLGLMFSKKDPVPPRISYVAPPIFCPENRGGSSKDGCTEK